MGGDNRDNSMLDWHEEDAALASPESMAKTAGDLVGLELGKGERLLWVGRPRRDIVVHMSDVLMMPMGIMMCGAALLMEVAAIATRAPWPIMVMGIVLGAMGFFFGFGRPWQDARQRTQMRYAVTSERVVFIKGALARRVESLNLETLSDISLSEQRDGSGTITFGSAVVFTWRYLGATWPRPWYFAVPRFELDDGARHVYEIICEARHEVRSR